MPVLLTGGASGIGRAIALRLAAEGARVGVIDRDGAGCAATVAAIRASGGAARDYALDITDAAAVERAVADFTSSVETPRGLVHCAGWDRAANFLDSDVELWRELIEINLIGALHVSKAVLARMAAAGAGRVVSVASDAARVGSSGESVYAACKAGLVAFSKSVARELAPRGITLNVVSPGPTDTPLFANFDASGKLAPALARAIPLRRLARPEDHPGLVAFLLSDDAAYITGQTISVSGGLTMHG